MKLSNQNKAFFVICLIISVIFFSYVFYKSEILAGGYKHDFYLKYYLISVLIFCASFLTFILKREKLIQLSLILASSIFSFYLVESFLAINSKKKTTENSKYVEEFKKNPPSLVPVIYFADHFTKKNIKKELVPLSGISNKKTIFCKEDGPLIKYLSDRYGFNNDDDIWEKNIFAITVGDSFTHGACVKRKNTIANNIEKKTNVLNLGFGGTGPLIQYAVLREYLNLVNTKRVIWIYYEENDLQDLIRELTSPILKNYLENKNFSQNLPFKQEEIDNKLINVLHAAIIAENNFQFKKLINFIKLKRFRNLFFDRATQIEVEIPKQFIEIISDVKEIASKKNINFYFVYLPEKNRYIKELRKNKDFRQYEKIKKIINDLEIPMIDLKLEFQEKFENPLSLYNKSHAHLNPSGYKLVGELISNGIKKIDK